MKISKHSSLLAGVLPMVLLFTTPAPADALPADGTLTFFKSDNGRHNTLIQLRKVRYLTPAATNGKIVGELHCTFNNQLLPVHPRVALTGTIQGADVERGTLELNEPIPLGHSLGRQEILKLLNDCYFEKLPTGELNLSGTVAVRMVESTAPSETEVNLRVHRLGIKAGGLYGQIKSTNLNRTINIPKLNRISLTLHEIDVNVENNQIQKLSVVADLGLPEQGSNTTALFKNVKFEMRSDQGMVLGTEQEFDLRFGSARLRIQGGILDVDEEIAGCPQPAYWNDRPGKWQGLYFKKASLIVPQLQPDAATISATELHLDSGGFSGKVEWDVPQIKSNDFEIALKPGSLKWVKGECVQGTVEGAMKVNANFFKENAQWVSQPVTLDWSLDVAKQPQIRFSTPAGGEIRVKRKGKETGVILGISAGDFSANTLILNGTINFSELAVSQNTLLKSAEFQFKNLKIHSTGEVSIGEMTNTAPVQVDAGPCRLGVTSLIMSRPNDEAWQIEMEGSLELSKDLPLKIKVNEASTTGKLSLTCDEKGIKTTWNDVSLNVTAEDVLGIASVKGDLRLATKDQDTYLVGDVGLNFDKLTSDLGDVYGQDKIQFLLSKSAWYIGGQYDVKPERMDGIALGKTGLRIYHFRGGMGQNIALNSNGLISQSDGTSSFDISKIQLLPSQSAPQLVADVIVGTEDRKTCWGRARLTAQAQHNIQLQGQLRMSEVLSFQKLERLREDLSTPNTPRVASVNILWDNVSKGFLIETNGSMLLHWQGVSQMDMKATGKMRLFMSPHERSLRIGSVDALSESGVEVTTLGGSKFKGAFYVKQSQVGNQWKITHAEMGVLWNKDFPIYAGVNMSGEVEGTLYYFADKREMQPAWREAIQAVQEQWWQENDLSQKAFVGRIRGKLTGSYSALNAQVSGDLLLLLTSRNLIMGGNAKVSAGILGINKTLYKTDEEHLWKFDWRNDDGHRLSAYKFLMSGRRVKPRTGQSPIIAEALKQGRHKKYPLLLTNTPLQETPTLNTATSDENTEPEADSSGAASEETLLPWATAGGVGSISVGLFPAH